ncbi:hypothetical protein TRIUR3_29052 [Triticum urartu]|uniref:Transcription repressor n=1 Tax=Triticum urartu TaxID=4572 RepID=M8ATG7_TRIUA|nr:hypothetical protein TRIUR3_29052 [Triticum urartu]
MARRKFRLSDMIPNAWFYKLRDMGAHGRGGVGVHHRSSSARSYQQPPSARESSARWSVGAARQPPSSRWHREVSNDVQQPEADVEPPATPTKESPRAPLPRRASYYYSTRDREVPAPPVPKPPRAKEAQSPTRSARRRHKVDHAPEERGPAGGKEPVVGALGSSGRRRDTYPVVKMSEDPRQDFRESMEEMISAKRIQDAEDLEDLLACYLSLNDAAHHDLIIDVFEQIWVSLAGARP